MSPLVSLLAATLALAATTQAAPLSALKGAANVEGAARQRRASTTSLQLSSTNNWSKRSNRRACAGDRCPSSRFNYNKNLKTGESCASGLRTSAAIRATRSADVQRFSSAQLVSAGSTTINGVSYDKFKFGGARTYSGQASDPLVIGSGGDCSTWSSCLTDNHRGGFKVSLAGTGYIFSSESKVELRGWGSSMRAKADGVVVKNQRSGSGKAALVPFGATTIETVCGGWCGQCIANLVVLKRVDTAKPAPVVPPPSSNKPRLVNKGGTAYNLLECHGDCDRDSDCQGTLKCFQRNGNQPVPGCASGGSGDVRGYDFCYKPVTQVPKPPVVPPSSNKPATTVYTYPGTITRSQASGAVSEPSRSNLKLTKDFTVSIWANPSQRVGGWARVLGKGSSYNRNFGLWIHPDGRVLSQVYGPTGTNVWNVKGANAPLNTWTHVAATFSAGKQHTLYINGAPVGSLRTTGTPRTDNEPLTLGKAAFHTGFAGSLAKARVSAFAMSAAQIKAEFAFGKPATTRPQIPTCRSGQYRFGSAPGVCKPCSNQSCKAGYKRTGSCSGTTNGYKCVVIPDVVCGTDQHRQGSAPGTCHACKNAVCPAGQRRTGSCSGTTNGYKCVVIPVCTTGSTNTKAMLSKLKPAAENFQECHDSVEGITNNLGDLKKGVVSAGDAAEKIHDVTSKIDTLLTKINKRGGVGSLLGKIPKVGIFIKMGLKTAGRIAEPLAKLTQLFEVSTTKLERAVKATEKLFVKMSKVTSPVSTLLTEGHGALQAAHVCAGQYVCDQAAGDMENANRKAYPQAAGVLSTISTAGQACATALSPVEAAIRALTAMARDMQQFLQPLADLLAEVGKFIDAMEDEIAKFMAALNDNKAVQCALEIFEPITDLANLATCPVDEAVAAVFHGIVDNLMKLVTDLVDKASKKLITDAVDALVPDDLHLTVPDFKKHLPSEFWLATCTIASLKFPDHASIIQQLNRAELPYTVTGKSIEQDILAEVIPATRLTTPTTEGYTSACVEAFKELGTDYKACSQLSYVPDRSLPSYQGCRQHYEEFPLTCTRCYTPTWSNPFPGCDTYNRAPVCPKGQELNWANICLSPCQEGYHDVLEVCWMDGI